MHNKGGLPVAFVEYQDVKTATDVMNRIQGFVLCTSERGGIRIEYAKSKMGEGRKDDLVVGTSSGHSPIPLQTAFQ